MSQELQATFSKLGQQFADLPPEVQANLGAVHNGKMTDQGLKEAIVRLRGSGVPVRTVCMALKCSAHTVQVAERENPELMATVKERTAQAWELVQTMCAEGLVEKLMAGGLKPAEMGLTGGIAGTKAMELRGEATVRVEVVQVPSESELAERAARLVAAAQPVIDVESVVSGEFPQSFKSVQSVGAGVGAVGQSPIGTALGGGTEVGAGVVKGGGGGARPAAGVDDQ